jgi:hypothetical protein
LPENIAANTPQYVVVNGTLNFNRNYIFAPGSEIAFTQNSQFSIETKRILRVYNTYLHGCTQMWLGITVQPEASLVLTGSTIEDAIKGVLVTGGGNLQGFSRIAAYFNTFRKNLISIELGLNGINRTKVGILKGGITANTFDGAGPLLPGTGVNTTMPYAGITVLRTTPLVIGSTGFASVFPLNNFVNFIGQVGGPSTRAIEVQNSNVTIQNCRFEKIGRLNTNISGFGVASFSDNGTHSLVIKGLGQNSQPTFTEVSCPISTEMGSLNVSEVNATNTFVGIHYYNEITPAGSVPGSIRIDHSNFDAYRSKTGPIFIGELGKLSLSVLRITNCIIRDNFQTVSQPTFGATLIDEVESRSGIRIVSSIPASLGAFVIQNNEFYNDAKSGSSYYQTEGIHLVNIKYGLIQGNKCYDHNSSANAINSDQFRGIWLDNCNSVGLYNNIIQGSSDAYQISNRVTEGITFKESGACEVFCNEMDLLKNGISFEGEGCDQTTLSQNKFNTHYNGLYLSPDAIIGQQGAFGPHENKWLSGAALLDGNYDFIGFDPLDPDDVNRVGFSKFIINNTNQNSIYWATPRTIGGVGDVDYWFTDDDGQFPSAPSLSDCANGFNSGGGRLSKADI